MEMKVIGMNVEKYIGQGIEGENCDFKYFPKEMERHTIYGLLENNKKIKITLWDEEGECGSGWCTAS
jgi:hypothetical protein